MNIFNVFSTKSVDPDGFKGNKKSNDGISDFSSSSFRGSRINVKASNKNWAYVAVSRIASVVAQTEWRFYKLNSKGEVEEVFDHFVMDLFEKPNNHMTGRQMKYQMAGQREFTGMVPIRMKVVSGKDIELHVLDSQKLRARYAGDNQTLLHYEYRNKTTRENIDPKNIVFFRSPDLFDSMEGIGTAEGVNEWLATDNDFTHLVQRLAKHGTFLGGILKTGATTMAKIKATRDRFASMYSGVQNSQSVLVLPKGAEFDPMTGSAKDMQFSEIEQNNRDKILQAFGVPKALLGEVDGDGRANVDGAFYGFAKYKIRPILEDMKEVINCELIPLLTSDEIFIDYVDPTPEDMQQKIELAKAGLAGGAFMTQNETREVFKLEGVDGGDEIPEPAASPFALSAEEEAAMNKAAKKEGNVAPRAKDKQLERVKKNIPVHMKRKQRAKQQKKEEVDEVKEIFNSKSKELEEAFLEFAHKEFVVRNVDVARRIKDKWVEHANDLQEKVLAKLPGIIDRNSKAVTQKEVFDKKEEFETLKIATAEEIDEVIKTEGDSQFELIANPAGAFNPNDKELIAATNLVFKTRTDSYLNTTRKALRKAIQEGISEGDTLKDIEKRVTDIMGQTEKYRADMLAQDLTFSTANSATESAYKQSGVVKTVEWYTSGASNVCEFCREMQGRVKDLNGIYLREGETLRGKDGGELQVNFGDIVHPPVHPFCNCYTVPKSISI